MLSLGLIQPIQASENMERMSSPEINIQHVSETTTIISSSISSMSITIETLENVTIVRGTFDGKEVATYEITNELRPVNNTAFTDTSKNDVIFEKVALINGTELNLPARNTTNIPTPPIPTELLDTPQATRGGFTWDGVTFVEKNSTIAYAHPDRAAYNINSKTLWDHDGSQLTHKQIGSNYVGLFNDVAGGTAELAALSIEEALATAGIAITAEVSLVLIATVAVFLVALSILGYTILDEAGSIWYWIDRGYPTWLVDNNW